MPSISRDEWLEVGPDDFASASAPHWSASRTHRTQRQAPVSKSAGYSRQYFSTGPWGLTTKLTKRPSLGRPLLDPDVAVVACSVEPLAAVTV